MTVNYSLDVATSHNGFTFIRLLCRWRGSIYKLLWRQCICFLMLYFLLSLVYRLCLSAEQKEIFEDVIRFCDKAQSSIPLTFLLGFYVSLVVKRWWDMFSCIVWPDKFAMLVGVLVTGADEKGRLLRRTAMRYVNLSFVLGLRLMSTAVKKRFPTLDHLTNAGLMTEEEKMLYEKVDDCYPKQWIATYLPCSWAITLLQKARREGRIDSDPAMLRLMDEVNLIRGSIHQLSCYDWVNIPLVYTQVVTIAVYSFFGVCLMSKQYISIDKHLPGHEVDFYFPLITVLQLFFYMGWLTVAETLINPFGEDDDDFEVNFILERNLQASYYFVDDSFDVLPSLEHDAHWNLDVVDVPHTAASVGLKDSGFEGSTEPIRLSPKQKEIATPPPDRSGADHEQSFCGSTRSQLLFRSRRVSPMNSKALRQAFQSSGDMAANRPSYGRSCSVQPRRCCSSRASDDGQPACHQQRISQSYANVCRMPSFRSSSTSDSPNEADVDNADFAAATTPAHFRLPPAVSVYAGSHASSTAHLETIAEDNGAFNESKDPLIGSLSFDDGVESADDKP